MSIVAWLLLGCLSVALLALLGWSMVSFFKLSVNLKNEISDVSNQLNRHFAKSIEISQKAGENSTRVIQDVYSRLGVLEEASRKILDVGKDVSKLQDVLKAPKSRGGFGELLLGDILREMIPRDRFELQHAFRNGTRVDAVILVGDHFVPIDAKFPLENFERFISGSRSDSDKQKARREFVRDVYKHIDAISEKYICPDEGTFDFAMMYVPAENVYYEMLCLVQDEGKSESISKYALSKRVIPVSPNSFYAYLQVILLGLRSLRVDEAAREITESIMKMQGDFDRVVVDFDTLGTHLSHARGSYEKVQRKLDQFEGKLAVVDQTKAIPDTEQKNFEASPK
jgi:DNA recombination protein RmuC